MTDNIHCKGCIASVGILPCDLIDHNKNGECPCSWCPVKDNCEEMCDPRWDWEAIFNDEELSMP